MWYFGIRVRLRDGGTKRETIEGAVLPKNNWIRRIRGLKRADKRRLEEFRAEVGGKKVLRRNW